MRYDTILFDLDGTLFDTSEGIVKGVRHALETFGYTVGKDSELYKFIGPPIVQAFREFYGMNAEQAETAKRCYREYYGREGVYLCAPIEGAKECLEKLCAAGAVLAVATSKPEKFAVDILERFGFSRYFRLIAGSLADDARTKKSEVVAYVLENLRPRDLSRTVMVGDRKYDVAGARENGLGCIGIDTGFSERGELENAGALFVVKSFSELAARLLP